MNDQYEDQNYIRSYLLGRLSETERELFEEKIFADPAFFDRVRMTEEELLEDHVFEVLPPEEAEIVADRLMRTPEQIERWQITAALKKYSDDKRKPAVPAPVVRTTQWQWGIVAIVLVAVVIGIWIIRATSSLDRQVASLNASGQAGNMQSDLAVELPALRLRSGPQENTAEPRLNVPKNVTVVQIRLPVEAGSYSRYNATLIREPDSTLFTLNDRQLIDSENRKLLVVRVPADALSPGEYRLAVKGVTDDGRVDDLGSYNFNVF
ncbi:MAG TPA: hypothetical protein VF435_07810 [Pyrinomonadaceae bacterium]